MAEDKFRRKPPKRREWDRSPTGRTQDFDSWDLGSNPSGPSKKKRRRKNKWKNWDTWEDDEDADITEY